MYSYYSFCFQFLTTRWLLQTPRFEVVCMVLPLNGILRLRNWITPSTEIGNPLPLELGLIYGGWEDGISLCWEFNKQIDGESYRSQAGASLLVVIVFYP